MKKKRKKLHVQTPAAQKSIRPLISVCLIARNEEEFLDRCLASIQSIADEIILIDTGSTDRTMDIAGKYTDRIYRHPWNDSFSEARNHYLRYAKGEWIFQIDADEELVEEDIPMIRKAVQAPGLDGIMVQIVSKLRSGKSEAVHNVERIFRNNGIIHYEGRVHNRLVGMNNARIFPIRIRHYGYDLQQAQSRQKFDRTVALLKMELQDDPGNPLTYHYLGCSYLSQGMFSEALEASLAAIGLADDRQDRNMIYLWSRYNAAMSYYRLGDLSNAEKIARQSLEIYPRHIDAHYLLTAVYYDLKQWLPAVEHGRKYLKLVASLRAAPEKFGNLVSSSLNEKWNIHLLIGFAQAELGQTAPADLSFAAGIESAPEPFLAWRALGIYHFQKNRTAPASLYLEQAHRLHPEDETVGQLLKKIAGQGKVPSREPTISCCMIVKDEEDFLEACLNSVKDHVDELIVVDTGSTDNTVAIARKYTDHVYFHPWEGSFSKARNQVLPYATGDWIFQIDGDEELVAGSGEKLRTAVRQAGAADAIYVNIISTYSGGNKTARHNFERLFRNNGVIHYESIVHNRVVGQTCTIPSKIELMHYGYNVDEKKANAKFLRTAALLKEQIAQDPDNPMPHQYLGTSYLARGMYREALEECVLAISLAEDQGNEDALYLSTHHNAAICFFRLGKIDNAREYSLRALKKVPEHLDSLYMMTILAAEEKNWEELIHFGLLFLKLRDYCENNPDKTGIIINSTISEGGSVNLLLGHAYHARKDYRQMAKHYQAAYEMAADTWKCWWNIGNFHMDRTGDLVSSRRYLELALQEAPEEGQIWYMLAKLHNMEANEPEEKRCLKKLFALGTQDVMILNRLASLSLSSGDFAATQEILDALFMIDNKNYTGLCTLGILKMRQDMMDEAMEALGKAAEIHPTGPESWFHLGEIALQLAQYDNARLFFERVCALKKKAYMALLHLCEVELRQERLAEFIHWCDLLMKELELPRQKTLHNVEDLLIILRQIQTALTHDQELSLRFSDILSLYALKSSRAVADNCIR